MSALSFDAVVLASIALADAIRDDKTLIGWPDGANPVTIDDAYRIQNQTHKILAREQAGWKVGWTTRKLQEANGVSEPMAGRVPSATVVPSGTMVREPRFANLKCEAELVFRFAYALPARKAPYSERELTAARPLKSSDPALSIRAERDGLALLPTTARTQGSCWARRSRPGTRSIAQP